MLAQMRKPLGDTFLRIIVAMTVGAFGAQAFLLGHSLPGGPPGLLAMDLIGIATVSILVWVLAQPDQNQNAQH